MLDKAQLSGRSVLAAASEFLAKRYPELAGKELTGLQLGPSWLVETEPTTPGGDEQPYKVVLMINRYGWVEEVGPVTSRQAVQRCLVGLQAPPVR